MARAREDGMDSFFNILERIATMEGDSNQLMQEIKNCGAECEPEEFNDRATALEQEQLRMQEAIEVTTNELASCLDRPMLNQLSTALQESDDYSEPIKRMPEDSPMHAICRLYIMGGKLITCSENLMDRQKRTNLHWQKKPMQMRAKQRS